VMEPLLQHRQIPRPTQMKKIAGQADGCVT
jgi:hypothetical protein